MPWHAHTAAGAKRLRCESYLLPPTAQLYPVTPQSTAFCSRAKQPGALEVHLVPLHNSSLMEEIQSLSSYKSPVVDELIKGRTASVDSKKQLCCYGVNNNRRDMPGLVSRAQLHWKCLSQQKSLIDFYLGTFQVQNFILNHIPKQSEKKSKEGSCVGSPWKLPMLILTEENISTKKLRICL